MPVILVIINVQYYYYYYTYYLYYYYYIADIIIPDLDLPGRGLGEDLGDSDGARPLVAAPLWIYQLSKVITD